MVESSLEIRDFGNFRATFAKVLSRCSRSFLESGTAGAESSRKTRTPELPRSPRYLKKRKRRGIDFSSVRSSREDSSVHTESFAKEFIRRGARSTRRKLKVIDREGKRRGEATRRSHASIYLFLARICLCRRARAGNRRRASIRSADLSFVRAETRTNGAASRRRGF